MNMRNLTPIVVALMLSGCAVGPDYQPPSPVLETEYLNQGGTETSPSSGT